MPQSPAPSRRPRAAEKLQQRETARANRYARTSRKTHLRASHPRRRLPRRRSVRKKEDKERRQGLLSRPPPPTARLTHLSGGFRKCEAPREDVSVIRASLLIRPAARTAASSPATRHTGYTHTRTHGTGGTAASREASERRNWAALGCATLARH